MLGIDAKNASARSSSETVIGDVEVLLLAASTRGCVAGGRVDVDGVVVVVVDAERDANAPVVCTDDGVNEAVVVRYGGVGWKVGLYLGCKLRMAARACTASSSCCGDGRKSTTSMSRTQVERLARRDGRSISRSELCLCERCEMASSCSESL